MKMTKRLLSGLLALSMVLAMCPAIVFAADSTTSTSTATATTVEAIKVSTISANTNITVTGAPSSADAIVTYLSDMNDVGKEVGTFERDSYVGSKYYVWAQNPKKAAGSVNHYEVSKSTTTDGIRTFTYTDAETSETTTVTLSLDDIAIGSNKYSYTGYPYCPIIFDKGIGMSLAPSANDIVEVVEETESTETTEATEAEEPIPDSYAIYDVRDLNADHFYAVVGGTGFAITTNGNKTDSVSGLTITSNSSWFKATFEVWGSKSDNKNDEESYVKLAYAEGIRAYVIAQFDVDISGYNFIKLVAKATGTGVNIEDLRAQTVKQTTEVENEDGTVTEVTETVPKYATEEDLQAAYQAAINIWGSNAHSSCDVVWADACFYADGYHATTNYTAHAKGDVNYAGIPNAGTNPVDLSYSKYVVDSYIYPNAAALDAGDDRRYVGIDKVFNKDTTTIQVGSPAQDYTQYLNLHLSSNTYTDPYVVLNVSTLNADRFYSIVGYQGTAKTLTDVGSVYRVYGSKAETYTADAEFEMLASSEAIYGYATGEFHVDIAGYNFLKLEVVKPSGNKIDGGSVAWLNPTVYSVEGNAQKAPLIDESTGAKPNGLSTGNANNVWYASDLYGTGFMNATQGAVRVDRPYGSAYIWVYGRDIADNSFATAEQVSKRYIVSAAKYNNAEGTGREFNLFGGGTESYTNTDIVLGYYGTKYDKGLATHPNFVGGSDNYVIYDVSKLGVENFYALVGATGSNNTIPAGNDECDKYRVTFEIWGSAADSHDADEYVKLAYAEGVQDYYVAEFNVDISDYNYIKLITKMDDDCVSYSSSAAMWANACFYGSGDGLSTNLPSISISGTNNDEVYAGNGQNQITYTGVGTDGSQMTSLKNVFVNDGWTLYDENTMGDNSFATYVNGDGIMAHINYFPTLDSGRLQIIYGTDATLIPNTTPEAAAAVATPSVSIIERTDGNLCMVVQLEDGSFIIIDGGYNSSTEYTQQSAYMKEGAEAATIVRDHVKDAETLLAFLEANKPASHEKPQVTWMLTHADPDHTGIPYYVMENYNHRFDLDAVIYNWPDYSNVGLLDKYNPLNLAHTSAVYIVNTARNYFPEAKHYVYHTGQVLQLAGAEIEFLYTPEDARPYAMPTANHTCGIWRFKFDSGYSLMITGDAQQTHGGLTDYDDQMNEAYGDYLKSDMMQVIHHGSNGGSTAFYNAVDPDIVFWPQLDCAFYNDLRHLGQEFPVLDDNYQPTGAKATYTFNQVLRNGERVHYTTNVTHTVTMPTISYDVNGGTGSIDSTTGYLYCDPNAQEGTAPAADVINLSTYTGTNGKKDFYGWDADGDGYVDYENGEEITVTESLNLVAVWAEPAKVLTNLGKAGVLSGKIGEITNIQYLSDLHTSTTNDKGQKVHSALNSRVVAQLNGKITLDEEYSNSLFVFDGTGSRWHVGSNLTDGVFTAVNGITYETNDIAMGYNGIKYEKGLGVHPDAGNKADRYIVYNVKGLGDYFYAVVGGTGSNITNPKIEDYYITFELWGSTEDTYQANSFVKLATAEKIRSYLTAEFNVDISGYNYIKLVVRMSDGYTTNTSCPAAWGDACVYSIEHDDIGKDETLSGKHENADESSIKYLSDLHDQTTSTTLNNFVVDQLNGDITLNKTYSNPAYYWVEGQRMTLGVAGKCYTETDGIRDHTLIGRPDLVTAKDAIILGYKGVYYEKGLGVHPNTLGAEDRFIVYNVSSLNADRFYSVVGANGAQISDASKSDRKVTFELWGSKATSYDRATTEFVKLSYVNDIRAYLVGEFDVDISGYNYIKLVVKLSPTATTNDSSAVAWGDACVYSLSETHEHTAGEAVIENNVDATCTTAGSYDSVIYCTECGEEISRETISVAAGGHSLTQVEAKAPTCTEAGYEAYEYCSNCDYTTYVEIPAAHTPGKVVAENIDNGTTTGNPSKDVLPTYDAVVYCTECGEEISRERVTATNATFVSLSMALDESLEIKFQILYGNVQDGYYFNIRRVGVDGSVTETRVEKSELTRRNAAVYEFKFAGLAAKQMSDQFYVTLCDADGNIISAYQDSMAAYIKRMYDKATTDVNRALFVNLLNYGAAAQERFAYGTEDTYPNKVLTEADQAYATNVEKGNNNQVLDKAAATSVSLENIIEMSFLTAKGSVTGATHVELTYTDVAGNTVTKTILAADFQQLNSRVWKFTVGIPLSSGTQIVTCTVYNGDQVLSVDKDSLESYLNRNYDSHDIMSATWQVICAAKAFFESK